MEPEELKRYFSDTLPFEWRELNQRAGSLEAVFRRARKNDVLRVEKPIQTVAGLEEEFVSVLSGGGRAS